MANLRIPSDPQGGPQVSTYWSSCFIHTLVSVIRLCFSDFNVTVNLPGNLFNCSV